MIAFSIETLWLFLDRFTILIAAFSALFAWWAWVRSTQLLKVNRISAERRKAAITIRLMTIVNGNTKTLDLPYKPRRDQLSRAEVVGILGLYYGERRFSPTVLRPILENESLSRVIEGRLDDSPSDEVLEIPVDAEFFAHVESELERNGQEPYRGTFSANSLDRVK